MFQNDNTYYERRLAEEQILLKIADSPDTAAFHREMARLYVARIESLKAGGQRQKRGHRESPVVAPDRATWSALMVRQFSVPSKIENSVRGTHQSSAQ